MLFYLTPLLVMDDSVFEIENLDFSQNRKKSKSRFYNKLVRRFLLTWNTFIFNRDNVGTFW